MPRKRAKNNGLPYFYMKIKLEFEDESFNPDMSAALFKTIINSAVKDMFGEIGLSNTFDILKYTENTKEALIRVAYQFHVQLWSSLTLISNYSNKRCAFRVLQVSPHLMALSNNSREMCIPTPEPYTLT